MKITMESSRLHRLHSVLARAEDAEDLGQGGYTFDAMLGERPVALEISIEKNGVDVLAAALLEYSQDLDGWYLGERITDADELKMILDQYIDGDDQ